MRLIKVFCLSTIILIGVSISLLTAQEEVESIEPESGFMDMASIEAFLDAATAESEELSELRDRLREIESMLLAQKDRENELLRDLNKFVIST